MNATQTEYKHIYLNEDNIPAIAGTSMKIVELMTSVKAYGWTPEELLENYPHLTLSKIYSALAYYWDNKDEIDADIERRDREVKELRQAAGEHPLIQKLRDRKLIK
ncbi:MAG: DUF433 domain-containing protein [Cyanobacteria bacterium SBLK]|nr:DUF433 domain-containing protein [Cyanobacteria bacterium SBLK]